MSDPPDLPNRLGPHDDPSLGWFANPPDGVEFEDPDDEDPVITGVELRFDEYTGPFRIQGSNLGEDFEMLHRLLGVSTELYGDAVAWNEAGGDWDEQQRLLRRLREELPTSIEVPAPREVRPREVRLVRLRVGRLGGERRLMERRVPGLGKAEPLPDIAPELLEDVAAWLALSPRFKRARGDDRAHFEWEDQGDDLCRRLSSAWGPDFAVRMY